MVKKYLTSIGVSVLDIALREFEEKRGIAEFLRKPSTYVRAGLLGLGIYLSRAGYEDFGDALTLTSIPLVIDTVYKSAKEAFKAKGILGIRLGKVAGSEGGEGESSKEISEALTIKVEESSQTTQGQGVESGRLRVAPKVF